MTANSSQKKKKKISNSQTTKKGQHKDDATSDHKKEEEEAHGLLGFCPLQSMCQEFCLLDYIPTILVACESPRDPAWMCFQEFQQLFDVSTCPFPIEMRSNTSSSLAPEPMLLLMPEFLLPNNLSHLLHFSCIKNVICLFDVWHMD